MNSNNPKVTLGHKNIIVFFAILACVNTIVLGAAVIGIATRYNFRNATDDLRVVYLYAVAVSLLGISVLVFSGIAILFAVKAYKRVRKNNIALEDLGDAFLNYAPGTMSAWDQNANVLAVNEQVLEMFGLDNKEQYINLLFTKLSPEFQPCGTPSSEKAKKYIDQAFSEGRVNFEWSHKTLSGEPLPVECTLVRVNRKVNPIVIGFAIDLRPIVEAHNEELEKLTKTEREATEHYDLMINTIPLLVNYWGQDHSLKGNNKASTEYYRQYIEGASSPDEAYRIVHDKALVGTAWFDMLDEIFELGAASFEFEDMTSNIWEVEGVRTIYNGEPVAVTYGKNITKLKELETEQRRREIAEESNIAKTMFIANISHEIRTPMNSILGYSELALEDDLPSKTREYLNMIVTSSKLLLSIVNDVLDISEIEADMLMFDVIPFTAEDIIAQCKDLLQQKASEKGLILNGHVIRRSLLTSHKSQWFLGDSIKIIQICINLLSNAIKFTKSGGVITMSIEIRETDNDNCNLSFECGDTGIGMTEEQMLRIFEPFMQADSSTKREYGGTGLGLTIAKRLIEAMGSELKVHSAIGIGSKFSFELNLPLIDVSSTCQYGESAVAIKKPNFQCGTVLVVDDNEINLGVACEHLKRVGLTPATARDGKEAVEKVKNRIKLGMPPYDLILMDLHMPEMDGKEASILISEFKTGTPIIAMTAETITLSDDILYENFKMRGYLSKPFTSQKIWQCLLTHLKPANIATSEADVYVDDKALLDELKVLFVESNKDTVKNLALYLEQGDIKKAHMLVHSLKSAAKVVGKSLLSDIAQEAELQLKSGLPNPALVKQLTTELKQVLNEYSRR